MARVSLGPGQAFDQELAARKAGVIEARDQNSIILYNRTSQKAFFSTL